MAGYVLNYYPEFGDLLILLWALNCRNEVMHVCISHLIYSLLVDFHLAVGVSFWYGF